MILRIVAITFLWALEAKVVRKGTKQVPFSTGPSNTSLFTRSGALDVRPTYRSLIENHGLYFEDTSRIHTSGPVLGYVTPWNGQGYDNAVTFRSKFTHISPVWYQIRRQEGRFVLAGGHDVDQGWLARLRDPEGAPRVPKVVPRVIFEVSPLDMLLLVTGIDETGRRVRDPATQDVIGLLVREQRAQGYQGYVIEGWSAWSSSRLLAQQVVREQVVAFLKDLRSALEAEAGGGDLILAVSPPLLYAASQKFTRASPLFSVRDYRELREAGAVTAFSLMTYDASNAGQPGPSAPLNWVAANLRALLPRGAYAERAASLPGPLMSVALDSASEVATDGRARGSGEEDNGEDEFLRAGADEAERDVLETEAAAFDGNGGECLRGGGSGGEMDASLGASASCLRVAGGFSDEFSRIMMGLPFYGNEFTLPQGGGPILGRDWVERLQRHRPAEVKFEEGTWRESYVEYSEGGILPLRGSGTQGLSSTSSSTSVAEAAAPPPTYPSFSFANALDKFAAGVERLCPSPKSPLAQGLVASALVSLGVNLAGFGASVVTQNHSLIDAVGAASFVASAWTTHALHVRRHGLSLRDRHLASLLTAFVTAWAARLGGFLYMRVQALGEDRRLRPFFPQTPDEPWLTGPSQFPLKLLGFFVASALWSFGVLLPVTTAHAYLHPAPVQSVLRQAGAFPLLLALAACYALSIETLVDFQKFIWHQHHKAEGKPAGPLMIGLYEVVRYPNYLSELTFWSLMAGLAAALVRRSGQLYDADRPKTSVSAAVPSTSGLVRPLAPIIHRATKSPRKPTPFHALPLMAAGPLFLYLLLAKVSGVPPTDAERDRKYGHMAQYRAWKARTPAIFPRLDFWNANTATGAAGKGNDAPGNLRGGFAASGAGSAQGTGSVTAGVAVGAGAAKLDPDSNGAGLNFKRKFGGAGGRTSAASGSDPES